MLTVCTCDRLICLVFVYVTVLKLAVCCEGSVVGVCTRVFGRLKVGGCIVRVGGLGGCGRPVCGLVGAVNL